MDKNTLLHLAIVVVTEDTGPARARLVPLAWMSSGMSPAEPAAGHGLAESLERETLSSAITGRLKDV